ncbi:MAG: hypothetical protein L0L73_03855, partial [Acidipropionibacterium jensenii]|nr:hypothetical protein [Acidipropionibacterium jensenii]
MDGGAGEDGDRLLGDVGIGDGEVDVICGGGGSGVHPQGDVHTEGLGALAFEGEDPVLTTGGQPPQGDDVELVGHARSSPAAT